MINQDTSSPLNPIDEALAKAGDHVLDRARRHNTSIVGWRDGKVVHLDPWTQEPVTEPGAPTSKRTDG